MERKRKYVMSVLIALYCVVGSVQSAFANTIALTEIQKQPASYINIHDVGTYREDIITDSLISNCTLPDAGSGKVPYWTGYILENKIFINNEDARWAKYTGSSHYFVEQEIAYLHDKGFNCARVVYSLSFLSKPGDSNVINMSELLQLDELISWGLKYNVHIMLSIIGLPGKAHTSVEEENVGRNSAIFTDPEITKVYAAYMEMLAMRYAKIPSKALSIELLAEPQGDQESEDSLKGYVNTLKPIAKAMWKYNPQRILIASDLGKQMPKGLAAIGCCLSLHDHIYFVNAQTFFDRTGLKLEPHWPMEFLPEIWKRNGNLILTSDTEFVDGQMTVCYAYYNRKPTILADGKAIYKPEKKDKNVYDSGSFSVDIPKGTRKLELCFTDEFALLAIQIEQQGTTITLPSHRVLDYTPPEKQVNIRIYSDGRTENTDIPQKTMDSSYLYYAYIKPYMDCAKKYGTSFLMTEVGTDTQSLTPDEYVAYHETWLTALSSHQIPWMYNCIHNTFAPIELMWQNQSAGFTQFRKVEGIPYEENAQITDMLCKYQND